MDAVEFQANVKNGVIEVPENYRHELENYKNVRVIILKDENLKDESMRTDIIAHLLKNPIKVNNFVPLKRDEIYDRS